MNTNSKRLGIYLTVMLILTAIATTLRSVAYMIRFDTASGFFTDKSLITIANVIVTVTVLGMFSYLFVASRINLRANFSTSATYVPTGILAVASAFLGARVFTYVSDSTYGMFFTFRSRTLIGMLRELLTAKNITSLIGLIVCALAFVSIAHHFFNAFVTESKDVTRAYFTIASIAFLALYSVLIYLDSSIAINEAAKALRQTAFLLSAAFFLYEARISLGREMWRIYTAFGLAAASLTAYTSIPAIIVYFAQHTVLSTPSKSSLLYIKQEVFALASIEEYVLLLALFIFIVARLCLTALITEEKKNELVGAIIEAAREREAEVNDSFERHMQTFASKQLSIFDLYGDEQSVESTVEEELAENTAVEEEKKELIISDDAIYEAIFGKMPERKPEAVEEEKPADNRDPEEIANDLFSTLDAVLTEDNSNI